MSQYCEGCGASLRETQAAQVLPPQGGAALQYGPHFSSPAKKPNLLPWIAAAVFGLALVACLMFLIGTRLSGALDFLTRAAPTDEQSPRAGFLPTRTANPSR